jgi:hypothetical protein
VPGRAVRVRVRGEQLTLLGGVWSKGGLTWADERTEGVYVVPFFTPKSGNTCVGSTRDSAAGSQYPSGRPRSGTGSTALSSSMMKVPALV